MMSSGGMLGDESSVRASRSGLNAAGMSARFWTQPRQLLRGFQFERLKLIERLERFEPAKNAS
jgi:hypothetical protein